MTAMTKLYLCFPDEATGLAVAATIAGVDPATVTVPPADGWVVSDADGQQHYFAIVAIGSVDGHTGWHCGAWWAGDEASVPAALAPYRVTYPCGLDLG